MRVTGVEIRELTWPLDGSGAARGRSERSALLLELRSAGGAIGRGEAAPLAEITREAGDMREIFEALAGRVPFEVPDDLPGIAALAAELTAAPAARFALETALLGLVAAERATSIAALLAEELRTPRAAELAVSVVVDTADEAARAFAEGARTLKIKVGPGELERVRAIARAVPGARLRLDANRSWPAAQVATWLAALADLPIDFVEEPCAGAIELLDQPLALPIALDESLAALDARSIDRALRAPRLAALILKPTLLGLFGCASLAARARAAGIAAIVTHGLEGPIGTAACAELALALGGAHAVGLAAHPALGAWRLRLECTEEPATDLRAALVDRDAALYLAHGRDAIVLDRSMLGHLLGSAAHPLAAPPSLRDPLSIFDAAIAARIDAPAILATGSRLTFAACAVLAGERSPECCIVATHSVDTIAAIYAALAERRPIALLHPKLPPAELARQRAVVERAELPPDAAVILFTSGSTGQARGVVLSRGALLAAAEASAGHLGWRPGDRWLLALSLAHAGGLAIVVRCLVARRPLVLAGEVTPEAIEGCTIASLVPTQLAALLDDPSWRPTRLRAVLLGGAAAPPSLLAAAAARGVPVLPTYGMTESFGQVATAPPDRAGDPEAPLVGLPGVELLAGTREAPARIRVRAPMLATCYLDGTPIAPELATADLGFVERGALHVIGRADDAIISGGENVHPQQVEAVLAATPGVRAACAFGVADVRWGQLVGAAIAVDDAFDLAAAAAMWHAALPPFARPRELAVVAALPINANGKLDRRAASQLPRAPLHYR